MQTLQNYKKLTDMIPELDELVQTGIVTKTTALAVKEQNQLILDTILFICYIISREGNQESGLPQTIVTTPLWGSRHMCEMWRLFLSPENLITQTNKGDNKHTKLNQIRICNIHWYHPPFFRLEGCPSENTRG